MADDERGGRVLVQYSGVPPRPHFGRVFVEDHASPQEKVPYRVDGVDRSTSARSLKIGSICMCYAMRIHIANCLRGRARVLLMRQYFVREARKSLDPFNLFHKRGKNKRNFIFFLSFFFVALTVLPNRNNRPRLFQCFHRKEQESYPKIQRGRCE